MYFFFGLYGFLCPYCSLCQKDSHSSWLLFILGLKMNRIPPGILSRVGRAPLAPTASYAPLIPNLTTWGCSSDYVWTSFFGGTMRLGIRFVLFTAESSNYLSWLGVEG